MAKQIQPRSNEPIFWGLFGAGGTLGAIFTPVLIVVVCFILPFSPISAERDFHILNYFLGKLFVFALIVLPIWCSLHRMHHLTHDVKCHIPAGKLIFYGLALLLTLAAGCAIFVG